MLDAGDQPFELCSNYGSVGRSARAGCPDGRPVHPGRTVKAWSSSSARNAQVAGRSPCLRILGRPARDSSRVPGPCPSPAGSAEWGPCSNPPWIFDLVSWPQLHRSCPGALPRSAKAVDAKTRPPTSARVPNVLDSFTPYFLTPVTLRTSYLSVNFYSNRLSTEATSKRFSATRAGFRRKIVSI